MIEKSATINLSHDDSIEEWIRVMYPEILRYCLFNCVNRSEAEDATQDTFLKTIRYAAKIEDLRNRRAFLYRIARNTCIDFARQKRPGILPEIPVDESGLRLAEANADFVLLVRGLSANQCELLLLRYQQELSIREIAAVLGIPLRTAQSRLRAALKNIEHTLGREDSRNEK